MNVNNITELKELRNKLELIPLADFRELVDKLNRKLNAIEDTIDTVLKDIDKEIDVQNKLNFLD